MSKPNKSCAFLAYFVPILGWLYVLLFRREDKFATYHAKQSLGLTIVGVAAPVVWAVVAWIIAWIPTAGPLIAVSLFGLVILTYLFLAVAWVLGMVYALQARIEPMPIVGGWAEQIPVGN